MLDFETIYRTRGEAFVFNILGLWERSTRTRHPCEMSLEDRWAYFLAQTQNNTRAA
ncbi:MAG: hypothetical protein FWF24_05560 [Alphaproteobacteria bacterium]|nr:hypothetical protein [Alphaproteobacteria bacterium]